MRPHRDGKVRPLESSAVGLIEVSSDGSTISRWFLPAPEVNKMNNNCFTYLRFEQRVLEHVLLALPHIRLEEQGREAYFTWLQIGEALVDMDEAVDEDVDYCAPLYATMCIEDEQAFEIKEQDVVIGHLPLMTANATFVLGGLERLIPSHIERLPMGLWRTVDVAEVWARRFLEGLTLTADIISERLSKADWNEVIPADLIDLGPVEESLHDLYLYNDLDDDQYQLGAYDFNFRPTTFKTPAPGHLSEFFREYGLDDEYPDEEGKIELLVDYVWSRYYPCPQ